MVNFRQTLTRRIPTPYRNFSTSYDALVAKRKGLESQLAEVDQEMRKITTFCCEELHTSARVMILVTIALGIVFILTLFQLLASSKTAKIILAALQALLVSLSIGMLLWFISTSSDATSAKTPIVPVPGATVFGGRVAEAAATEATDFIPTPEDVVIDQSTPLVPYGPPRPPPPPSTSVKVEIEDSSPKTSPPPPPDGGDIELVTMGGQP